MVGRDFVVLVVGGSCFFGMIGVGLVVFDE